MNRRVSERMARLAEMFPDMMEIAGHGWLPTDDEDVVFNRYGLSREARLVATYAAREHEGAARACYSAIVRSLVPR